MDHEGVGSENKQCASRESPIGSLTTPGLSLTYEGWVASTSGLHLCGFDPETRS